MNLLRRYLAWRRQRELRHYSEAIEMWRELIVIYDTNPVESYREWCRWRAF